MSSLPSQTERDPLTDAEIAVLLAAFRWVDAALGRGAWLSRAGHRARAQLGRSLLHALEVWEDGEQVGS